MNPLALIERVQILFSQNRTKEAAEILESYLEDNANDYTARFLLAHAYLAEGKNKATKQLVEMLQKEDPDDMEVLELSIRLDIAVEYYNKAESKCELLIQNNSEEADSHLLMAQVLIAQKRYDKALEFVNYALSLDPENLRALNMKVHIDGFMGTDSTQKSIEHALELDPENPYTIANHGIQLLNQGKQKEALDRIYQALEIDPNNEIAQYALVEALKSKFWIYRLFYKYKLLSARLTANGSWAMIIGIYVVYRLILSAARNNPEYQFILYPIVYLLAFLFILTWLIDAFMNMYLLTNRYGRVLLDEDEKKSAQYCAIALLCTITFGVAYLVFDIPRLQLGAIASFVLMIPLASFLSPTKESNRKTTRNYTYALVGIALVAFVLDSGVLLGLIILAVFIYQWVINGILIKENSRVLG